MLDDLFKRTEYLVLQSVECMCKQMLKLLLHNDCLGSDMKHEQWEQLKSIG